MVTLAACGMIAAGCSSDGDEATGTGANDGSSPNAPSSTEGAPTESAPAESTSSESAPPDDSVVGESPISGGQIVYAIEAETPGGYCIPESQLSTAGVLVTRSLFDTLTAPDASGSYVPFLAETVESNADATEWTIGLRDGVLFHDGTELTAEVVKNNLDAYRGAYPGRAALLYQAIFQTVTAVEVVDPATVSVTLATPWPAFPAYLWGGGRVGMMAQAQLDDAETCATNPIGTGPFQLDEWVVNDHMTVSRNPDYWQDDADGVQLPYLDGIEFRPIVEGSQRLNALESGEVDVIHTTDPLQVGQLRELAETGDLELLETSEGAEVGHVLFNASVAPFDNPIARQAAIQAVDRQLINDVRWGGIPTVASGPFPPGNVGHLDDAGLPPFDPSAAEALVEQYESETGQALSFTVNSTTDPDTVATAQMLQEMWSQVGIDVDIAQVDPATLINQAIGGQFQATMWRNHAGGDPDEQYLYWREGSPVNFGRMTDPTVNDLLDRARVSLDPDERRGLYEELNQHFGSEGYALWLSWLIWGVGAVPGTHGLQGADLPDGAGPWALRLASGHPTSGIWVED